MNWCIIVQEIKEISFYYPFQNKRRIVVFLNNYLTKAAIGLRFSPFDIDEYFAYFYRWLEKPTHESDEQSMKFKETFKVS